MQVRHSATEQSIQLIPDEAIRLRILANSDSMNDQQLKYDVRDAVNKQISRWVAQVDDIHVARKIIEKNIHQVEQIVKQTISEANDSQSTNVQYQSNVTFPEKTYGHYVYPAGEYEAVLITLGEGKGENWWCVLFPPLCFLDFSNESSVTEASEQDDRQDEEEEPVKVEFFLLNWLSSS